MKGRRGENRDQRESGLQGEEKELSGCWVSPCLGKKEARGERVLNSRVNIRLFKIERRSRGLEG